MAVGAILNNRGMLLQERAALFGMAGVQVSVIVFLTISTGPVEPWGLWHGNRGTLRLASTGKPLRFRSENYVGRSGRISQVLRAVAVARLTAGRARIAFGAMFG